MIYKAGNGKYKRCEDCGYADFETLDETKAEREVVCTTCGHVQTITFVNGFWEGDRERYERNRSAY